MDNKEWMLRTNIYVYPKIVRCSQQQNRSTDCHARIMVMLGTKKRNEPLWKLRKSTI